MADATKKQANPLGAVAGIVGAAAGYGVSQYCGMNMLIPGAGMLVIALILAKSVPATRKPLVGAVAVQGGQLAWFLSAAVLLHVYGPVVFDIVTLAVGLTWLLARPGILPILLCGIYQLIGTFTNLKAIAAVPVGSAPHRALVMHLVLRALAILCLVFGYLGYRKKLAAIYVSAEGEFPARRGFPIEVAANDAV